MLKNTSSTLLFKGVLIAVLLHVVVGVALLSNTRKVDNSTEPRKPEAVPAHKKVTPSATVPKTHDNHQIHEGLRTSHSYSWLDSDGVKHYSDSVPPPGARNVEFRKESKSGRMSDRAPIVENSVATESAVNIQKKGLNSHYERLSENLKQQERTRLEGLLEIYERRYWQRKKTIISLEEKERLLRPISEKKEKLLRLQVSPEKYFGFVGNR